jgi:hypothetical protein
MNKQKQSQKYLLISLIIIQASMLIWIVSLQAALNIRDTGNEHNVKQILETTSELRFCLDNQIQPCNDTSLEQWNTKHPDNTFVRN